MVATAVEMVQAANDAARAVDLDGLSDRELDAELVALLRERHRLESEIARRAARWDARTVWLGDGSRSPAARLSRDAKLSKTTAQAVVRRGRALSSMPLTARAWSDGEISADHVDLLARVAGSGRDELFARDEHVLVGNCATLLHTQAIKAVRYWCNRADAELGRDGTPPPPESHLSHAETFEGTIVGEFTLDAVKGAAVVEGLRRIEHELYLQDQRDGITRTKPERLGAALYEMAMRAHTAPKDGKRPEPLVVILAGEATLEHLCELATGTVIAPDLIVPHLCRAMFQTIIFDGADKVIAGSKQRTFRGLLRRAIQVRDRHCQHPAGCDAPIVDCDVNHRTAWRDTHVTREDDGDLECHPHNRDSDLHDRAPADVIEEARWRREAETVIRQRVEALTADRQRPPPDAAA